MPKPSAHLATAYTRNMVEILAYGDAAAEVTGECATRTVTSLSSTTQDIVRRRYLTYNQQVTPTRKWRNWQTHQT
jgi:hypothetical protein